MDGMGAADHFRALVLTGEAAQGIGQGIQLLAQQDHGALQLQRQAGIQHIAAGHAHMDVTAGIANVFVDVG